MALCQEITYLILSVTFYLMAPIDYINGQNIIHKVIWAYIYTVMIK